MFRVGQTVIAAQYKPTLTIGKKYIIACLEYRDDKKTLQYIMVKNDFGVIEGYFPERFIPSHADYTNEEEI